MRQSNLLIKDNIKVHKQLNKNILEYNLKKIKVINIQVIENK